MTSKSTLQAWIKAFRLRTLPLAIASISMGGFLAAAYNNFSLSIFLLCVLTTVLLQVLSNLANDYGDYVNGADLTGRIGPERAVQSGIISPQTMRRAIVITSTLAFAAGIGLLYISRTLESLSTFGFFLLLGLLSILASIRYTAGKNPYGYSGLGDIAVLIFFGWIGVGGSFFLQTQVYSWHLLLPATSCGLFATGVLNINNIRDIDSDTLAGKRTIPMRIGRNNAVLYHIFLLGTGILLALLYTFLTFKSYWQFLFVLSFPFFIVNIVKVKTLDSQNLDPYLKQMAISTLIFVFSFGIGLLLARS
jgi:1,4-dihydroxy-2-naphthoate octaprenyltransferase